MSRTRFERSAPEQELREHTDRLLQQVAAGGDPIRLEALLEEVVLINLPIARSIAWRFRDRGCALEDLEQTACMALVRAARDFEVGRGSHFLSYAVPCISGSVKKYFRDTGWTVRPPRLVQELQLQLESTRQTLDPRTGAEPTTAQLAQLLDVDEGAVREALGARGCFTPTSLDLDLGDGHAKVLGDLLVAPADGALAAAEARAVLRPALATLDAADRQVLTLRFVEELTQQQMSEALGIPQPSVSRALQRILQQMHACLTGRSETPAA